MLRICMLKEAWTSRQAYWVIFIMTHEANLSDKQIEDEWQLYCDELPKDTDGAEDGKGPDV